MADAAHRELRELVRMIGWVGVNPLDDTGQAHLLLHPGRDAAEARMRDLAGELGLARADGDRMPTVPPDVTWLTLADSAEGRSVRLRFADLGVLWWPVRPEWEAAATSQPDVVLWCGLDRARLERDRDVDRYLDRTDRVYAGVVHLI